MSNEVYANTRELACAAGNGKTVCATPDVCFTPPENPATPPGVPVPYPNSAFASDTTDGSKTIQISGKEVMLKNQSYFKKSTGDEAGCAAKKGAISSSTSGKVYFVAWSMDVMLEGENAVRHLDMTTNNHACPLANEAVPWPFVDMMAPGSQSVCNDMKSQEKTACADYEPHTTPGKDMCKEAGLSGAFSPIKEVNVARTESAGANACAAARRCRLVKYNGEPKNGVDGCCPSQTPDHIVPKSSFYVKSVSDGTKFGPWEGYKMEDAPCMCLEGGSCSGSHGLRHAWHKAESKVAKGTVHPFSTEVEHCAKSAHAVAPHCNEECLKAQLIAGHEGMGDTSAAVKHSSTGRNFIGRTADLLKEIKGMLDKAHKFLPVS